MFADHMKGDSYTQHTYKNYTIDWIPKQISTNPLTWTILSKESSQQDDLPQDL